MKVELFDLRNSRIDDSVTQVVTLENEIANKTVFCGSKLWLVPNPCGESKRGNILTLKFD